MRKVILKLAVAVGQSEWAKRKAAELIAKLLAKADAHAAIVGGIEPPK